MRNEGGPIHPILEKNQIGDLDCNHVGMYLRDWFAGQILNGFVSCNPKEGEIEAIIENLGLSEPIKTEDVIAKLSYSYADAMLRERNEENDE